jgi:hypothetical protein
VLSYLFRFGNLMSALLGVKWPFYLCFNLFKMRCFLSLILMLEGPHVRVFDGDPSLSDAIVKEMLLAVREDFAALLNRAMACYEQGDAGTPASPASRAVPDPEVVHLNVWSYPVFSASPERIFWYGGMEGTERPVPIGRPEDYLPVRANREALKGFLGGILDKGRVPLGMDVRDGGLYTNSAYYVSWLYKHNENLAFKKVFLDVLEELLREQLDQESGGEGSSLSTRLSGLLTVIIGIAEKGECFDGIRALVSGSKGFLRNKGGHVLRYVEEALRDGNGAAFKRLTGTV